MRGGTARGRARAAETGLGAEAGAGSAASCIMKEQQSFRRMQAMYQPCSWRHLNSTHFECFPLSWSLY